MAWAASNDGALPSGVRNCAKFRDPTVLSLTPGERHPGSLMDLVWRSLETRPSSRSIGVVWAALLLLATLPYVAALRHPFVYDDHAQVVRNDLVRSLDPRPALTAGSVTHGRVEWYRPLAVYSLAVSYAASGLDPMPYRLFNLGLHAANTLLVLLVASRLLQSNLGGFGAAAFFAVHAVHSEAVIPAFGRADLLAAFFVLLGWYLSLSIRVGAAGLGAIAATFLAALLSKENGVSLFPVVFATDLAVRGRGVPTSSARVRQVIGQRWKLYLALAAVLLFYAGLRFWATGSLLATAGVRYVENPLIEATPIARVVTAFWVAVEYVRLFLIPYPLVVDYSYNQIPVITSWADRRMLTLAGLVTLVTVSLRWLWRRRPDVGLALVLFALLLAPVANVFVSIGTIMAERLLYLPSVALCFLTGLLLIDTLRRFRPLFRIAVCAAFAVLIGVHAAATMARSRDWASEERLFASAVTASPNSAKARFNYAAALVEAGQVKRAEESLRMAVTIAPIYPEAHNLMGTLLLARDDVAGAGRAFELALRDAPTYPPALGNLGIVRRREGRIGEARGLLERAVAADPSIAVAHVNLALIAEMQGDRQKAIEHYRRAYALDPSLTIARARADDLDSSPRR